jgi:hypothetical protein
MVAIHTTTTTTIPTTNYNDGDKGATNCSYTVYATNLGTRTTTATNTADFFIQPIALSR